MALSSHSGFLLLLEEIRNERNIKKDSGTGNSYCNRDCKENYEEGDHR